LSGGQGNARDRGQKGSLTVDAGILALAAALRSTLGDQCVAEGRPLTRYTSLRVGGPADLLVTAESAEALRQAVILAWEQDVACYVLGNGSNVLVADGGIRGLVVINKARAASIVEGGLRAESGAALAAVARLAVSAGLGGLEWASGIPGTVGGAVVGNAGAWGNDVASTLRQAVVLEANGNLGTWSAGHFEYGYRTSLLKRRGPGRRPVVLEAEFRLQPAEKQSLRARVAEISSRRRASQPAGASCGSVFKNPPGDYAGRLVEMAGLKGERRGGAMISPIHANFVVNDGSASARDIRALVELMRQEVQARFGVTLELEIELLGEWHTVSDWSPTSSG
jgi:UDP-N-acetylmuramate dehydrogenase